MDWEYSYSRFKVEVFYFTYYGYVNIIDTKLNTQIVIDVFLIIDGKLLPYLLIKTEEAISETEKLLEEYNVNINQNKIQENLKLLRETDEKYVFRLFFDSYRPEINCEYITKKNDIFRFNLMCLNLIKEYNKFLEIGNNRIIYEKTMDDIKEQIMNDPEILEQIAVFGIH
jgi:hypothetical protein